MDPPRRSTANGLTGRSIELAGGATYHRRMVDVSLLTDVTPEVVEAFARLVPQLSTSAAPLDAADLEAIIGSDTAHLLIARDDLGTIVGSMTLIVFRIPTGLRGWIEDVVVDEAARGTGVGEALNRRAIDLAYELGARTIDLTSRPNREAANRLYQKLGFVARETNVYRHQPG